MAARAGVHPATVSRALDPARTGRVSALTSARVRRVAEELNYRPDRIARSLRTRRSGLIGIVLPDLANPVIPPIVRGIEEVLWRVGYACVLADTNNVPEREAELVSELRDRGCDGFIISSVVRTSKVPEELARNDIAAVLVTRATDHLSLPLVTSDDASGMNAVVAHLVELGHRRIAYLAGPPELSTTAVRQAAFVEAVVRHGIDTSHTPIASSPAYTTEAALPVARELLQSSGPLTAMIAGNDMIAIACLTALEAAGLRCPDDVSVVGFNDMPLVDRLRPALTTVSIPQHEIGAAAANVLLKRILSRDDIAAPLLLPTHLVVRASTSRINQYRPIEMV